MKQKKIPLRKCVACGESKPKKELIRIVKDNQNNISMDKTGKLNGRGAYICLNSQCLELAKKNKKLNRALEAEISNEIYENLKDILGSNIEE